MYWRQEGKEQQDLSQRSKEAQLTVGFAKESLWLWLLLWIKGDIHWAIKQVSNVISTKNF